MNKINSGLKRWFDKKIEEPSEIRYEELKEVTLIIPSYNRQNYLLRQLVYWNGSKINLIILDGSPESLPTSILKSTIFKKNNFKYYHLPISIEERLNKAKDFIETSYVALLGDDEFYLKGTLKNLVRELEDDSELIGCTGQPVGFSYGAITKQVRYFPSYNHRNYSAIHKDISKRLAYAMNPYNAASAYGLYRKEAWVASWGSINRTSCIYVPEMQQALATYIQGKYKAINQLYWFRSNENAPADGNLRKFRFHEWWSSDEHTSEKSIFISYLSELAITNLNISSKEAKDIINNAINEYVLFCDDYFKPKSGIYKNNTDNNFKYDWKKFCNSTNAEDNNKEVIIIEQLIHEFHSIVKPNEKLSEIIVDVSAACNAECPFCPRVFMPEERTKGFMCLDLYSSILDNAKENGINKLRLYSTAEPTLHPEFDKVIDIAKEKNFFITLSTNASKLFRLKESIIKVDILQYSIEGWDKESYEKYRYKLLFDNTYQNIKKFYEYAQQLDIKPKFTTNLLITKNTNIPKYMDLWGKFMGDVRVHFMYNPVKYENGKFVAKDIDLDNEYFKLDKKTNEFLYCNYPFNILTVAYDGKVALCCDDFAAELKLGDLNKDKIENVFFSEKMDKIRAQFYSQKLDICKECTRWSRPKQEDIDYIESQISLVNPKYRNKISFKII